MKRLASLGWTFAVGPLFVFTLLGYTLQLKSRGAGVAVLLVAGLVALGSLSSQRRNRSIGAVDHWSFDELLITIGYGLLAASAPLLVGLIGSFHELTGDPFPIGSTGLAGLIIGLCTVVVFINGRKRIQALESGFGLAALVPVGLGLIVVVAVILQGGLSGNHLRHVTFQGASWNSVAAGIAIAIPFFFGADFSVTQSTELGDDAQRWSRANLIWLIAFFALLQYSGAIGTAGVWPDIPAFSPLANAYVGGSVRGVAWFLVIASGVMYCILLSVLFSRRLRSLGANLRIRVGVIAALPAVAMGAAAAQISTRVAGSNWMASMTSMFLNVSSVGGALLVAGLAAGCIRALLLTRAQQMDAMEYVPGLVGLLGLCVAFYGYFWRGIASAPMSPLTFAAIVATVLLGVAIFTWRKTQR